MIVSDIVLKIPGKRYQVLIHGSALRRLTTMEWLILKCASKFQQSAQMKNQKVGATFEKVFKLKNNVLLLRPCIDSLAKLHALELPDNWERRYYVLTFADLKLTAEGKQILKDGRILGENRDLTMMLTYNPLTGEVMNYYRLEPVPKDAIDLGENIPSADEFPREQVLQAFEKGKIDQVGQYHSSQIHVNDVEEQLVMDQPLVTRLRLDMDSDGTITVTPKIDTDEFRDHLMQLLMPRHFTVEGRFTFPILNRFQAN